MYFSYESLLYKKNIWSGDRTKDTQLALKIEKV